MPDLSEDEESVWRAALAALRSKGATAAEAIDGATIVLQAYQRQRRALAPETEPDE